MLNFNLSQINSWCINTSKTIYPIQNQKQITHESNELCMLQTGKKATRSVKDIKKIFINVIGDKFAISIRWGKLTISFCKKLSSCILSYLYKY